MWVGKKPKFSDDSSSCYSTEEECSDDNEYSTENEDESTYDENSSYDSDDESNIILIYLRLYITHNQFFVLPCIFMVQKIMGF